MCASMICAQPSPCLTSVHDVAVMKVLERLQQLEDYGAHGCAGQASTVQLELLAQHMLSVFNHKVDAT